MRMMMPGKITKLLTCARHSASYYFTCIIALFHLIFATTLQNRYLFLFFLFTMSLLQTDSAGSHPE